MVQVPIQHRQENVSTKSEKCLETVPFRGLRYIENETGSWTVDRERIRRSRLLVNYCIQEVDRIRVRKEKVESLVQLIVMLYVAISLLTLFYDHY